MYLLFSCKVYRVIVVYINQLCVISVSRFYRTKLCIYGCSSTIVLKSTKVFHLLFSLNFRYEIYLP